MPRIFIAAYPPRDIFPHYLKLKASLKDDGFLWALPTDLHMTITPPFHSDAPDSVFRVLKDTAIEKYPKVLLNTTEYGGNSKNPSLIWLRGAADESMGYLYSTVNKGVGQIIKRAFTPHITLARIFGLRPIASLPQIPKEYLNLSMVISEIYIVETLQSTTEGHYKKLYSVPLKLSSKR